jgi:hypothetical protein
MVKTPPCRSSIVMAPHELFWRSKRGRFPVRKSFAVGIADDRDNKPAFGTDSHPDVIKVVPHQLVAVEA